MAVSNNNIFNSVVKELYCPKIDLSNATKFVIYKAFLSNGFYNNCIQLTDSNNQTVCFIYINYNQFTNSSDALNALVYGYHFYQSNNNATHSYINWDAIDVNRSYAGNIHINESHKQIGDNPHIASVINQCLGNSFYPFFNIISADLIKEQNRWILYVKDRKGILLKSTSPIYNLSTGIRETEYGIIDIHEIPKTDKDTLKISQIFDSADSGLSLYQYANIDLNEWRPTIGDGIMSHSYSILDIIKGSSYSLSTKHRDTNCFITWNDVENEEGIINLHRIEEHVERARQTHTKFSIVFMPSNMGSTMNANWSLDENNQIVYYHFPNWTLDILMNDLQETHHPYKFSINDPYTGETIQMYNLDWRGNTTKELYKASCARVVNALKTKRLDGDTKYFIDYIDFVKVAFIGTWGEGVKFNCDVSCYPSSVDLCTISNYIKELFQDTNIICLLSLSSYLNNEFPQEYREHILNGDGYFYDSIGAHSYYLFQETANGYRYDADAMNSIFLAHKSKPIYLECTQYISSNNKPSFRNLISYIKYFRGAYINIQNVFNNNYEDKYNTRAMIQELSRYVGTKLAILSYFYRQNGNMLQTGIRFINCGSCKIYHRYWKLKYHIGTSSATISHTYSSDYDLRNIPTAFEEDAPNWHDAVLVLESKIPLTALSASNNCIYISIEDEDNICENLYLSNSSNYLPRTENGLYKLLEYSI